MIEIEKLRFCNNIDLENEELEYLNFALKIPMEEIRTVLNLYDNSSPKLDELKLVMFLEHKYLETRENVLKRINQVRQITKYEEGLEQAKKYLFELKNK